jgi:DNA (cytosine-5)-methyltransferase 1
MTLRLLDTFSGIGGFSLAARWLGGFETVQFVELDPFCRRILKKHWPDVPIHQDICNFRPAAGFADVIVAGFPCQDISIAGKQRGIKEGTRSGLFYELMRVICLVGPKYIVLENVAAIVNGGLDAVLGALAEAGYDCEWACIKASDVGACHQRDRWWCVAYAPDMLSNGHTNQYSMATERGGLSEPRNSYGEGNCGPELLREMLECRRYAIPSDASGVHSERWGEAEYMASQARAGKGQTGQRQWNGNAAVNSGPAPPDPMLQQRERSWPQGQRQPNTQRRTWQLVRSDQGAPLSPDWRTYVSEPVLCRGNDGLSGRVDRLKALGNAVVPHAAMIPLARVLELEAGR